MAKNKEVIKGRALNFDEIAPSFSRDETVMCMQNRLIKGVIQEVSANMANMGADLYKLEWETGDMGRAIDTGGSKFDVHTDLLGTDLKNLTSTMETQTGGQVLLLSTQLQA